MTQHRNEPRHLRILSGTLVAVFMCFGVLSIVPGSTSADSFPKSFDGHVYEGDASHPVVGAYVVVSVYDSGHVKLGEQFDPSTDSNGWYYVSISIDVAIAVTVEVTATYGGTNQKTVTVAENDNMFSQHIDVPFPYAIPQLAGILGMLAAVGAVGVVAMVGLRMKRRQPI